jgi:hypothetical protein
MYFIDVDESGSTALNDRYQRFFVLAALVAKSADCLALEERFNDLKVKMFPGVQPEEIEIKGRNLVYGHEFFGKIQVEIRQAILQELHSILQSQPLVLFATIVDKGNESLQRLGLLPDDVYRYGYKNLLHRVDPFLRSQNAEGLILIDCRASSIRSHLQDARIIAIHREFLKGVTREGLTPSIVEYPIFVQSQFFGAVQLADLCAYELFHACQKCPELDALNPDNDWNLAVVLKLLSPPGRCERIP